MLFIILLHVHIHIFSRIPLTWTVWAIKKSSKRTKRAFNLRNFSPILKHYIGAGKNRSSWRAFKLKGVQVAGIHCLSSDSYLRIVQIATINASHLDVVCPQRFVTMRPITPKLWTNNPYSFDKKNWKTHFSCEFPKRLSIIAA